MDEKLQKNQNKELGQEQEGQKSSMEEEYFDPHVSKKKKIIFWLYLLCLLAFIVSVLTLISKAYDPVLKHLSSDNFYFSNQIVNQWKLGFVTDIKVLKSTINPTCPDGYQHAFSYNWRGTGFGCLCSSGQNTTFVLQAYCSPALIQSNCTNIGSQPSSESHFWSNNSNICIKRSSVSFANEMKFDNTNKICGSSQSLVVVPLSQPCPLVNVSLTQFGLQDHIYVANDPDKILPTFYAAYNSTSPYSFYSYPIVKFSVSEGEFCQINEDTGLSGSHEDFVLLSVPKGCASEGNFTEIDEISEYQFYNNNPSLYQLTQIKGFPQAGNWRYKFGFAAVGSWTYQCRHNLNKRFSIQKASKQFNFEINSFLQSGSWVMIISCIIIAVEIFLLALRRCVNNTIYPVGYKKQHLPQHFWWAMTRYIVDFICKILVIVFSVLFTLNGYLDWHWFKQVQNYKCHHDNMQMVQTIILPYQKIHFKLFQNSLAVVIITVVMFIVDTFHFQFIYKNELSYYLIENNQLLVNKDNINGDKMNDLKWLQVENIQQLQPNKNDDQLRITMAQNLFASEDQLLLPSRLKKKKKKITNKKLFNNKEEGKQRYANSNNSNGANYLFDDDVFNIENLDQPSTTVLKPSANLKKRSTSIRKKK